MFLYFLAGEVVEFGGEDVTAAFEHLAAAHGARAAAAAGRGKEDVLLGEGREQCLPWLYDQRVLFVVVDDDLDLAGRDELLFGIDQQAHQDQNHRYEGADAGQHDRQEIEDIHNALRGWLLTV